MKKNKLLNYALILWIALSTFCTSLVAQSTSLTSENVKWKWHEVRHYLFWNDYNSFLWEEYDGEDNISITLDGLPDTHNSGTPLHAKVNDIFCATGSPIPFDNIATCPSFNQASISYWGNSANNPSAGLNNMKAQAGQKYTIPLTISRSGDGRDKNDKRKRFIVYVKFDYLDGEGIAQTLIETETPWDPEVSGDIYIDNIEFTPPSGSTIGNMIVILIDELQLSLYQGISAPFYVEGVIKEDVPIVASAELPKIPEFVLAAPPGDQSSITYKGEAQACREVTSSIASSQGNNTNVAVQVGVKGSVGIIAAVDIEVTAEVGGGFAINNTTTESGSTEKCFTTTSTTTLQNIANSLDLVQSQIFIGYSGMRHFGEFRKVIFDPTVNSLQPIIEEGGITYYDDDFSEFTYQTSGIQAELDSLNMQVLNPNLSEPDKARLMNQIDIWNKTLANESSAIQNAIASGPTQNIPVIGGQASKAVTQEISVTQTETIEIEFVTEGSFSAALNVDVAGIGGSASTEFTFGENRSQGSTEGTVTKDIIEYEIKDDDIGDKLEVDVYTHPQYGTPIFVLDQGESNTSCPYEGGYRNDQPDISYDIDNCSDTRLEIITGTSSYSVSLEFCNESIYDRTYQLSVEGNNNDAKVTEGGTIINNASGVTNHPLAPNSCKTVTVGIAGNGNGDGSDDHSFNFLLSPECSGLGAETDEADIVSMDISFINGAATEETSFPSPVSYWDFDNTVGDIVSGNDGTIIGDGYDYGTGVFENGIDLDGGSTHINMGNDPSLDMTNKSMTISAWFRVDQFTDAWQTLISKGEGDNYRVHRSNLTNNLAYNGPEPDIIAGVDINDGMFHHIVGVTEAGVSKTIYIDGIKVNSESITKAIDDSDLDLLIGKNPDQSGREWNGVIDDVAIWDIALSDCDIDLIYNSGSSIGELLGINNDCPANQDLTGTQTADFMFVSAGYISSDQSINNPAEVDYNATTEISFLENFQVQVGAILQAFIDGCSN